MKMLETSSPDYPEKAVRQILANLVNQGPEGVRKAKDAVSKYLKSGLFQVSLECIVRLDLYMSNVGD